MGSKSDVVDYGFGQMGSGLLTTAATSIFAPRGKVIVAITMLEDTVFDASGGLIADIPVAGNDIYIGTDQPAHDLAAGAETTDEGTGGKVVDSVVFPKGITIYGRWTKITNNAATPIIAYIGN